MPPRLGDRFDPIELARSGRLRAAVVGALVLATASALPVPASADVDWIVVVPSTLGRPDARFQSSSPESAWLVPGTTREGRTAVAVWPDDEDITRDGDRRSNDPAVLRGYASRYGASAAAAVVHDEVSGSVSVTLVDRSGRVSESTVGGGRNEALDVMDDLVPRQVDPAGMAVTIAGERDSAYGREYLVTASDWGVIDRLSMAPTIGVVDFPTGMGPAIVVIDVEGSGIESALAASGFAAR